MLSPMGTTAGPNACVDFLWRMRSNYFPNGNSSGEILAVSFRQLQFRASQPIASERRRYLKQARAVWQVQYPEIVEFPGNDISAAYLVCVAKLDHALEIAESGMRRPAV